jgi:hypothetical protein
VVTLAGWAHQPAQSVLRPARGDRERTVVPLSERGRFRESGLAFRYGAALGSDTDLVADDTLPGDGKRLSQRIEARQGL